MELNQKHQSFPKQVESRSLDTHSTCCTQSESVNPFSVNVSANALQLKDDIRDVTAALHVLAVRRGNPLSAAARRDTVSWSLPPCSLSTAALGNTLLACLCRGEIPCKQGGISEKCLDVCGQDWRGWVKEKAGAVHVTSFTTTRDASSNSFQERRRKQ